MRFASVAANALAGSIVAASIAVVITMPAHAETQVGAMVCGGGAHATLTLTSPHSDSVVASPVVNFHGSTAEASEIMTTIDGAYDQTIALPIGQSDFSFDVTLGQGTHSVQVTALDVCGGSNASTQVVVSYQPKVDSEGSQVATRPTAVSGPVANPRTPPTPWLNGALAPLETSLGAIGSALDLLPNNNAAPMQQLARVGLVSIGMTIVAFGSATPYIAPLRRLIGKLTLTKFDILPRIIGVILFLIGMIL